VHGSREQHRVRKNLLGPKSARQTARAKAPKKNIYCPIVGIGDSADGFEAAMELLRCLPPSTGMAFVIVQHLDPHHASRRGPGDCLRYWARPQHNAR
jgi:chemotaxis response regulator CheB